MPLSYRNDEQSDERLNPASKTAHSLNKKESDSSFSSSSKHNNLSSESIAQQEQNTSNQWVNKITKPANKLTNKPMRAKLLKRGAAGGGIVGGIVGIFFLIASFTPALVINQFVEVFQRFNTQAIGIEKTNNYLLKNKLNEKTKGFCGKTITIRCKFSSFSKREVRNLEAAGIKMIEPTTKLGRTWPKSIEFEGKTYSAAEFLEEANKPGSRLGTQFRTGSRTKLLAFEDKIFRKVAARWGVDKKNPFLGAKNNEERFKKIQDKIKKNSGLSKTDNVNCNENKKECKKKEKANKDLDEVKKLVEDNSTGGKVKSFLSNASRKISFIGPFTDLCDTYYTIQGVEKATKGLRLSQMVTFATIIATTADMIRAGEATEGDVEYVGKLLTSSQNKIEYTKNSDGTVEENITQGKTATDSFAYRNATYGDQEPDTNANLYSIGAFAGAGLLSQVKSKIGSLTGASNKTGKQLCKGATSFFGQAAALTISGVGLIFSGGASQAAVTASHLAVKVGIGIAVGEVVKTYLMPLILDMLAGTIVDEDTFGEAIGNIYGTGISSFYGNLANAGGNLPLTPTQAASQQNSIAKVNKLYKQDEALAANPFSITNPNSIMGSIASSFMPYSSKLSSLSGGLHSLASITINPFYNYSKKTYANTVSTASSFTSADASLNNEGIASTKQNVPIFGVSNAITDINPNDAYKRLLGAKNNKGKNTPHIDYSTGEPLSPEYKKFIKECFSGERKWGKDEADDLLDDEYDWSGSECIDTEESIIDKSMSSPATVEKCYDPDCIVGTGAINNHTVITPQERRDFTIMYQAVRVQTSLETDFSEQIPSQSPSGSVNGVAEPVADGSENISCPAGAKDVGIHDGYLSRKKYTIRICSIDGFKGSGRESRTLKNANNNTLVNARFAKNTIDMINAMKKDGLNPSSTSSFRTNSHQAELYRLYRSGGGNAAASPGTSRHQMGYAIDFNFRPYGGFGNSSRSCRYIDNVCTAPGSSKLYDWLVANAKKYGFSQLRSEYWHWSIGGQ